MPIDVDVRERLAEIARATLTLVAEGGTEAVTVRSVARQLGGSTARVTNYVPSRGALLLNAVRYTLEGWKAEIDRLLDGAADDERLLLVARWSAGTEPGDDVVRQLLVELLSRSHADSEITAAVRDDAHAQHTEFLDAAQAAGAPDPQFVADVLHLTLRGFYLASLEDPEGWTSERVVPLVERLVEEFGRPRAPRAATSSEPSW